MPVPPSLLASGALVALAAVARPSLRNWGSTSGDRSRGLPGDGLIADERAVCTMATTIDVPPATVWPWLAQMGTDRAGWYSFDHLDRGGRPSSRVIEPRWSRIEEGDRMVTLPGRSWFDVAHVEPDRSLVLRASLDLRGRPFDPRDGRPRGFVDSRWGFFLDSPGDGTTRLLVRSGSASGPRPWSDIIDLVFWHPAHVIMQIRQLRQIKSRAERQVAAPLVVEPRGVVRSSTSPS
jgi:proline iminopeptidase